MTASLTGGKEITNRIPIGIKKPAGSLSKIHELLVTVADTPEESDVRMHPICCGLQPFD